MIHFLVGKETGLDWVGLDCTGSCGCGHVEQGLICHSKQPCSIRVAHRHGLGGLHRVGGLV